MILDLGMCANRKRWLTRFHPYPGRKVTYKRPGLDTPHMAWIRFAFTMMTLSWKFSRWGKRFLPSRLRRNIWELPFALFNISKEASCFVACFAVCPKVAHAASSWCMLFPRWQKGNAPRAAFTLQYFPGLYWHTIFRYRYASNSLSFEREFASRFRIVWMVEKTNNQHVLYFILMSNLDFVPPVESFYTKRDLVETTRSIRVFSSVGEYRIYPEKHRTSMFRLWSAKRLLRVRASRGSGVCSPGKTVWNYNHRNAVFSVLETREAFS